MLFSIIPLSFSATHSSVLLFFFFCLQGPIGLDIITHLEFSLLPWLLEQPLKLAPTARLPIQPLTARDTVQTVATQVPGSVLNAVNHFLNEICPMCQMSQYSLSNAFSAFPRNLNPPYLNLPRPRNLNQVPDSLDLIIHYY